MTGRPTTATRRVDAPTPPAVHSRISMIVTTSPAWESAWCALRTNGTGSGYVTTKRDRNRFYGHLAASFLPRSGSARSGGRGGWRGQDRQHLLAVLGQLRLAESRDLDQGLLVGGSRLGDRDQRRIGEDAEGRHLLVRGLLLAPLLEQRERAL